MEIFAMIFAILMIAAAVAATILIGVFAGGVWGALISAALLILACRAIIRERGTSGSIRRDQLNAFQRPLADD